MTAIPKARRFSSYGKRSYEQQNDTVTEEKLTKISFSNPFRSKLSVQNKRREIQFDVDNWRDNTDKSHHTVCDKLCLKRCFLDELSSPRYTTGIGQHRNTEEWVFVLLEKNFDAIKDESLKQNLSTELLDQIGFKGGSDVVKTILSRSDLFLRNHDDPMNAVRRFVADTFKYSESETPKEFKVDMTNPGKSFSIEVFPVACYCDGFLKDPTLDDVKSAIGSARYRIDELRQENDNEQVLFHGTDIESAYDISSGGISLSMGSKKRDFSDGSGFYLTDDFEQATYRAFSVTQKPVVLIFCIPKSCFENAKKLNLSEESKGSQWKEIVHSNRAGILGWNMRKSLKKYDCIEGPVSSIRRTYSNTSYRAESSKVDRCPIPNSYQLCVIDEHFADEISKCLKLVVNYC